MTKTFTERCKMSEQCLPDAPYRAMLTILHSEMLTKLAEQPAPVQEPFGYFKAEPFGWTDCAETDEGAIALYTTPQAQPKENA